MNRKAHALESGLEYSHSMRVETRHTVPEVEPDWPGFVDMPPVFATAMMIGFVEQTCIQTLRPYLGTGQHSVGTHVDISHSKPTPMGMTVTATVTLKEVDQRKLAFRVYVVDDDGLIAEGTHERVIIDVANFMVRVLRKSKTG